MEKQGTGFLNDTSLSKTPRSPLKTSTVMKPSGARKPDSVSNQTAVGDMGSSYVIHNDSSRALHEVVNIPNFVPTLKFTGESAFNDSSLDILDTDNFSDFTDSSKHAMINTKPLKLKNRSKGSKSFTQKKITKCIKENYSLNSTRAGNIDNESYDSSSSDIEYEGTNIPELNMDYDALPTTHASTLPKVENAHFKNRLPEVASSSGINTQRSDSSEKSVSNTNSCIQNIPSFPETAVLKTEDSRNPRDSIFETFEPQYDSFLKTLMSNVSSSDPKVSKFLEGKSLDIDSQMESILQNQSLAEQYFLKSLDRINWPQNAVKFCADEISARSSSFRSPSGTLKSSSEDSAASSNERKQTEYSLKHHPRNEGFQGEEMLSGCLYERTLNKISEHHNTYTKNMDENPDVSDSAKSNKNSRTYLLPEQDSNKTIHEDFDCDLNYKTSFVSQKFQASDSVFISSEEAMEVFQKDEENMKQEKMFEMGKSFKESMISNWSLSSQTDKTAPSWFLDRDNYTRDVGEQHISIGTLFSARSENLGKLSLDPKRERPFFGTNVSSPCRNDTENSYVISDSSELGFKNAAPRNEESTLKSFLYESLKSNNEYEILGESVLSQILNDASTSQPLELAFKIFDKCRLQERTSRKVRNFLDKPEQSSTSKCVSAENMFTVSNTSSDGSECAEKMASRLGKSSSMDNLGNTENGSYVTEQEVSVTSGLGISNVESNNRKIEANNTTASGSSKCCIHRYPQLIGQPLSSCASLCNNPMSLPNASPSQYGCMKHFGSFQHQCNYNAFPPYAIQPFVGYSLGFQYHNPYIQDSSQVLTHPASHPFQQTPMRTYSSLQFPVSGSATICPSVQGPAKLVFPEKISIGDTQSMNLTVQNLHNGNYFYHISSISALVNGKPVSLEISGITLPRIIPRSSGTTTDIQVTLSPKYDGKIIMTIQVTASSFTLAPSSVQSSFLQSEIHYESLRPSISLSYKEKDRLDIGPTIAGSTVMEIVTLSNKCDASVPLCISLSSDIKDNRICFGLNQMKCQKSVNCDWKMISPKAVLYRLPAAKNNSIASDLEIPIIFEAGKEDYDANFVLTAAMESTTLKENLALLRISASVGIAKLILADPTRSTLLLQACSTCKQNVVVKNHAPFNVVYDIHIIDDDTHSFSVSPASLDLKPMQTSVLSVSFVPSTTRIVKGYLQAAAQPHGKIFALVKLIGDASLEQANPINAIRRSVPMHPSKELKYKNPNHTIECNKKCLVWGGVDVGNSVIKTFLIRNSSNKSLQTKVFVKEKSKSFKLLDDKDQPTVTLSLVLTKEEKRISVVFSPTRDISASGFLAIKPLENEQKLFSMPLVGYGGLGKLEVKGLSKSEGIGHCLDICLQREVKSVFNSITVHNAGSRALFIKVITSVGGASEESKGQVQVNSTEFVLLENENKVLFISSTVFKQYYSFNATDFGTITLWHGDEIMRQQMRRSRNDNSRSLQNKYLGDVNFDVHFDGEERVPYDSLFQRTPNFSSLFAASVKRFLIHLNIIETNNFSQMSFDTLSVIDNTYANLTANSTMSYRRFTTPNCNSPPVEEFTTTTLNKLLMPLENFSDTLLQYVGDEPNDNGTLNKKVAISWTVKPDTLTIDAISKDNRILLINLSNLDLKFRIDCEIHVISVSPVSGIITARGQIGLRITIPYNYSKQSQDYEGRIKVICNGMEKSVHVTVLRDKKRSKEVSVPNETNLYSERKSNVMETSVSKMFINSPPSVIQNICNFPKEIVLNAAAPGKVSETVITIQNMENSSVLWNIDPISMLFTESMEDSLNCGNVFQVLPFSGSLQSKETINIVIKFLPSSIDNYFQYYEMFLTFNNDAKRKSSFKINASSWLENGDLSKSVNVDISSKELDRSQKRK